MRVHLVFAHPSHDSFIGACLTTAQEALAKAGHEVDLLDLYADGFDPVLDHADWQAYRAGQPGPPRVQAAVDSLKAADAIAFIYPTWWFGPPAILKGYFDRVWRRGVAFVQEAGPPKPGLTHLQRMTVVTSAGAPSFLTRYLLGDPHKRAMIRGMRRMCTGPIPSRWLCHYQADIAPREAAQAFLAEVDREFAGWR
jgi:putative NADPH-quinone reductase